MELKLTREERKRIMRGDYTAIKRPTEPSLEKGDEIDLSYRRGGAQVVAPGDSYEAKAHRARLEEAGKPLTVDIPRERTVWIVVSKNPYKRINAKGETEWVVEFDGHDVRQSNRMLGAAPSAGGSQGLRTRWRDPDKVPTREEERDRVNSEHGPEAERGYVSGGHVIDPLTAVDDDELAKHSAEAKERHARFKREMAKENADVAAEQARKRERVVRDHLRLVCRGLDAAGAMALLSSIERKLQEAETERAA